MKMGEMPKIPSVDSDAKDFKKFETPKTRAQVEAEKNALKMEGGANSDNPSGASSNNDIWDFPFGSGAGNNQSNTKPKPDINPATLPGATSKQDISIDSAKSEIEKLQKEIQTNVNSLAVQDKDDIDRVASKTIQQYDKTPDQEVLEPGFVMSERQLMQEVLKLAPEPHDKQISELINQIPQKGVKNTMNLVHKMNDPHLEDDFHRALVAYITSDIYAKIEKKESLSDELHMVLYEVQLGSENPVEQEQGITQQKVRELDRLLKTMEQFYAGMLSVTGRESHFVLEVAKPIGQESVSFYVALPKDKMAMFEAHLMSIYPDAKLFLQKDDYNIFVKDGSVSAGTLSLAKHFTAPLKTYKEFTHDPLNIVLGAFSGLSKDEEGACIQFVISDEGEKHNDFTQKVITNMRKNKPFKKAVRHAQSHTNVAKDELKKAFKEMVFGKDDAKPDPIDETLLEQVVLKSKSRILPLNIRIMTSAKTQSRANALFSAITSTFNQFENPRVNSFTVNSMHGNKLQLLIQKYIYRKYDANEKVLLNMEELSTIVHLTAAGVRTSRELKQSRFKHIAPPIEITDAITKGQNKHIVLGQNKFGAKEVKVPFLQEDRMRHFYEIGQTGTGKTYLMKSMIVQDILNGEGVCYIDPHGTDIQDILALVPPERADDLIYFDPAHTARPYGLNILEWDERYPEQKTFVTNELYEIFVKLFGDVPESLGPMFQQYYRNATMLALEGMPAGKATMADIPKVFANKEFRHKLLKKSKNPIVNQFWLDIAETAGGDASLENVTPYITAKTDTFLSNEIMRPIIAQEKSTLDFADIMNSRKILLVNLSKGRIGELNAQLLGLIIVGKFLQSALARVDDGFATDLPPFYLYIDEFQNFTTPSIATILSEARKYKLSLNLAHQFIKQLDEKIRDAVFGNVGSKCVFRVAPEDAEFLEKTFAPDITAKDLTSVENFNAYISLLVNGSPVKPFNMETISYDWEFDYKYAEKLKQLSFLKYGIEREIVEEKILKRYMPDMNKTKEKPNLPWM